MMKQNLHHTTVKRHTVNKACDNTATERLHWASLHTEPEVLEWYGIGAGGYSGDLASEARARYGENIVTHGKRDSVCKRIVGAFINPFTVVLLALAAISVFTDIVMAAPEDQNPATVVIITVMVMISGILRFVQETKSGNVAEKLLGMIHTTAAVVRDGVEQEISIDEVVVGDVVLLCAGDMIPADLRILSAKDLFISQSALTGESEPVEKLGERCEQTSALTDTPNLAFMGSTVVSGSAKAIVIAVGNETMIGTVAKELNGKPQKTGFEKESILYLGC